MKDLSRLIHKECTISKELQRLQRECDTFEQAEVVREEQEKHYKKYLFLSKLNKTLEKAKQKP